MSYEERLNLATALDEIYSLIGWLIQAPNAPLTQDVLFGASEPDHGVTDNEMRALLVSAYNELDGARARLLSLLSLGDSLGDTIDEGLTLAGLTGPSWELKLRGWRGAIETIRDRARQDHGIKIAF